MKPIILWVCILLPFYALSQQATGMIEPLSIGSKIPDIELNNVVRGGDSIKRLSQLRGKLIVLDFWNLTCEACLRGFEKMDSLQKVFAGKIQIIAVNKEGPEKTEAFFLRKKKLKIPSIPFVTGDTILSRLFPYVFVPVHVWIDQNGIVRFITNDWNLNDKNIDAFLNGKQLALSEKKYAKNFSVDGPLFAFENGKYLNSIDYYSYIGHCVSGISIGNRVVNTKNKADQLNRVSQGCSPPIMLFQTAFSEMGKYHLEARNTIIFENVDTTTFIPPPITDYGYDTWQATHLFNYDLVVPEDRSPELFRIMQEDLMRYFGVQARIEKRLVPCYVLVRTSKVDKIKSLGNVSAKMHRGMSKDSLIYLHNVPMKEFASYLRDILPANGVREPFIDHTNYKGNIDIGFRKKVVKPLIPSNLNMYLKDYDLKIIKKKAYVDVLAIRPLNEKHKKE